MNKYFVYLVVLTGLFLSKQTIASEINYGIGASFDSDLSFPDSTFYFPINTKNYIFEPTFSFSAYNQKPNPVSSALNIKSDGYNIGLGIYKKATISNNTILFFGANTGYLSFKSDINNITNTDQFHYTGLYFEPTLGVEYFLSLKFSAGMNISVGYAKYDINYSSQSNSTASNQNTNDTFIYTTTQLIFRYHF